MIAINYNYDAMTEILLYYQINERILSILMTFISTGNNALRYDDDSTGCK